MHFRLRCYRTSDPLGDAAPAAALPARGGRRGDLAPGDADGEPLGGELAGAVHLRDGAGASRAAAAAGQGLPFAIERRADGALLGYVSVSRVSAADAPRRGALGYWLGEAHQRRGYMREAVPAAVGAGFERLGLDVIEAAAQPGNEASFGVMRSCGMEFVREAAMFAPTRGREEMCLLHEVRRPA